jgi:RNA polymerase sigma factor (sigma-70 family)
LLRRFAADRDEAAFEELMRRHGPLVWGVCRRALPNRADAEDAFQATFLVLAQRARAIRKPDSLGCWLHGVAYRVARRMRGQPVRTSSTLGDVQSARVEAPSDGPTVREFLAALDEELTSLPEKYRAPLVLCYLREQTRDEAARQLGVSLSTLKRRLEAARECLRVRLARRGVELPATLAAATLAGAVPPTVASATLRAATTGTAAGVVSAQVLTVTEGVVRAMWETKLRAWAAGVFMATTAVGGSGYFVAHTGAAQPGDGPGPAAASDKPAAGEQPAAQKPAGEDLSDPLARTKRLRRLKDELGRLCWVFAKLNEDIFRDSRQGVVGETLDKLKDRLAKLKAKRQQGLDAVNEASRQFNQIAAMGPIAWDKSIPTDPDVRAEVQRQLVSQVTKNWEGVEQNRHQARSPQSTLIEAELKFAEMELAAFRAATKAAQPAARGPVPPASPELRKLREEKLKAAKEALELALIIQTRTSGPPMAEGAQIEGDFIYDWSRRVLETEREIDPSAASRVKAAREHLDRMKALEKKQAERVKGGVARRTAASAATFYRLEAEIWLKEAEAARARTDANEEIERMRQTLDTQQRRLDQLRENAANRAAELERDRSPDRLGLAPIPEHLQPKLPANYRGKVTRRDSNLIVFEPGLDAGVQKDMKLRVRRLGDKGKHLGTVTVLLADPKRAVGRFTPASGIKSPDDYPEPGDEVRPE